MTVGAKNPWTIPGGKIEDDETPKTAMLRELKEETGIDLNAISSAVYHTEGFIKEAKAAVFLIEIPRQVEAMANAEIHEVRWVPAGKALEGFDGYSLMKRTLHVTRGPLYDVRDDTVKLAEPEDDENMFTGLPPCDGNDDSETTDDDVYHRKPYKPAPLPDNHPAKLSTSDDDTSSTSDDGMYHHD